MSLEIETTSYRVTSSYRYRGVLEMQHDGTWDAAVTGTSVPAQMYCVRNDHDPFVDPLTRRSLGLREATEWVCDVLRSIDSMHELLYGPNPKEEPVSAPTKDTP